MKALLVAVLFFLTLSLRAQHHTELPAALPGSQPGSTQKKDPDTSTLAYALRKGSKVDLHIRLYYMSTDNEEDLSDYYALAFGGGLRYETGIYKGFQFKVGGFFVWNLSSSDLTRPDPVTGLFNRYEVGQFDMEDFSNKSDLDRLEHFQIKYHFRKSVASFGKQVLNSPFINPQDGRMRPTGEQGLWVDFREIKKTTIQGGWLTKISPRGTVKWYDIDESIGIYPPGFNTEGGRSSYKGNLESKGVGVLGVKYQPEPNWSVQFWDYYVENIFNTLMLQSDVSLPLDKRTSLIAGFQFTHQNAINGGGNESLSKTYFDPRQRANLFSGRLGVRRGKDLVQANFTRITDDGRFLFPREWGREPLYTFLKRERSEGAGDVKAFSMNYIRRWNEQWTTEVDYGYYDLPGVTEVALNKYGLPSYHQFVLDMTYHFGGFMKGLNAEFLYTYKLEAENVPSGRFTINKVNMHHLNLILNYHL